jgi:hypothetical protein
MTLHTETCQEPGMGSELLDGARHVVRRPPGATPCAATWKPRGGSAFILWVALTAGDCGQ